MAEQNPSPQESRSRMGLGVGLALGVAIGSSLGIALQNWLLGFVIGVAIGIALSVALTSGGGPRAGDEREDDAPGQEDRDDEDPPER